MYYLFEKCPGSNFLGYKNPSEPWTISSGNRHLWLKKCMQYSVQDFIWFLFYFYSSCYIDGRVVKVMDFLKTRLLDTLSDQIRKIQKVSKSPLERRVSSLGMRQEKVNGAQLNGSTVRIRVEKQLVQVCMVQSSPSQLTIVYCFSNEEGFECDIPSFNNKYFVIVCF